MNFFTIKERINMMDGIKKTRSSLWFPLERVSRFKSNLGPARALHSTHTASIESVNLR